jgi:hypothetical protein
MAFKRIVANSEEDLKTIMSNINDWFKNTNDYKTEFSTEKRKFQDPDTKAIVEKSIDVIKVTDKANDKFSTIKFLPMKEKGEMKVEIGGEGEAAVSGKISNQMKGKGQFKSYSKDKKVALKEEDKKPKMTNKIEGVLDQKDDGGNFKYKNQTIKLDYEPGSKFANLINDLEDTRLFKGSEDALSNFMASKFFEELAKNRGIKFKEPDDDSRKLKLAPEKPNNPKDSIPRQTRDMSARPGATPGATSYTDFDLQELLKKGKVKKSILKEIIKREYKK